MREGKKQTVYKMVTDTKRARIKARKKSAFRGNIIYHTQGRYSHKVPSF